MILMLIHIIRLPFPKNKITDTIQKKYLISPYKI